MDCQYLKTKLIIEHKNINNITKKVDRKNTRTATSNKVQRVDTRT